MDTDKQIFSRLFRKTFLDAAEFVKRLPDGIAAPKVTVQDEEIGFFWRVDNFCVDVCIVGDGTCSYWYRDDKVEKSEKNSGEILCTNSLPDGILKKMRVRK